MRLNFCDPVHHRAGPEFWREVSLTTVQSLPYSRAVDALVHDAMRSAWIDHEALAV